MFKEKNLKTNLKVQRGVIIAYLLQKQQTEDWHGVVDAAMDLRDIDAKLEILDEYENAKDNPQVNKLMSLETQHRTVNDPGRGGGMLPKLT